MSEDEIRQRWLAGVPDASISLSGTWDDGATWTKEISGPIVKGVHRVGWLNWQVGYSSTADKVVIVPGIKRHWFRWTAERALRGGKR